MQEHSLIYMTNLYNEAMDLNTKLLEELEDLKGINEEHRYINGKLREENKRLNNIINELEKYINEEYVYDELGMKIFDASTLQDKLQELKGESNE